MACLQSITSLFVIFESLILSKKISQLQEKSKEFSITVIFIEHEKEVILTNAIQKRQKKQKFKYFSIGQLNISESYIK